MGTKILDEDGLLELIRTKPGKKSKYEIAAEAEVSCRVFTGVMLFMKSFRQWCCYFNNTNLLFSRAMKVLELHTFCSLACSVTLCQTVG